MAFFSKRLPRLESLLSRKYFLQEKKRCADISAINWINQRNRNKMKEQFLSNKVEIDIEMQDDPFTRKKERMKVVAGKSGAAALEHAASTSNIPQDPQPTAVALSMENNSWIPAATSSTLAPKTTTPSGRPPVQSKSASNLFDLHSSIKKIDLDIDLGKLTRPATSSARLEDTLHLPTPRPTAPPPTSGTSLLISSTFSVFHLSDKNVLITVAVRGLYEVRIVKFHHS
ncbi:unnamed protein product [Cylicostephanus goldi]|uniref:Uncharacterized protein n=1 Tax=Cylicostephanus goldi TaxID=71465 RepID=A0A3P6QVW9_CYLGO|nr:unnamed protein product [Cylicostephanus goldi]